jgi:hypothetical protein
MMNPRDLLAHAKPSAVDGVEEEEDHTTLVVRTSELVSLLRTFLSHTRFSSLTTDIVADTSIEGANAWQ